MSILVVSKNGPFYFLGGPATLDVVARVFVLSGESSETVGPQIGVGPNLSQVGTLYVEGSSRPRGVRSWGSGSGG
jgi:hypothetical protein